MNYIDDSALFLNKTERLFIQFIKELQDEFEKRGNLVAIKIPYVRNFFDVKFHVQDEGVVSTIKRSMYHYNDYVARDGYKYDCGRKRMDDGNVFWLKRIEKMRQDNMYKNLRDGIVNNF